MSTGRRLFVLESPDSLAMGAAVNADGVLPAWTELYTLDALLLEGYATPAADGQPARLTPAGIARWERHCTIHATVHAGERRYHTAPMEDR